MKQLFNYLALAICAVSCCSCSNDGRLLNKFIKRINANEVNAMSNYIYPADHANLYLFKEEVLSKSPNVMFSIQEKHDAFINGQKCIIVTAIQKIKNTPGNK